MDDNTVTGAYWRTGSSQLSTCKNSIKVIYITRFIHCDLGSGLSCQCHGDLLVIQRREEVQLTLTNLTSETTIRPLTTVQRVIFVGQVLDSSCNHAKEYYSQTGQTISIVSSSGIDYQYYFVIKFTISTCIVSANYSSTANIHWMFCVAQTVDTGGRCITIL